MNLKDMEAMTGATWRCKKSNWNYSDSEATRDDNTTNPDELQMSTNGIERVNINKDGQLILKIQAPLKFQLEMIPQINQRE